MNDENAIKVSDGVTAIAVMEDDYFQTDAKDRNQSQIQTLK